MGPGPAAATTLEQVICCLYQREINCSVASFWDLGVDVKLGDEMNGFVAEERFHPDERYGQPLSAAADWLWQTACRHYPALAQEHAAGRITWIAGPDDLERERIVEWLRAQGLATAGIVDLIAAIERGEHWRPHD